MRYSSKGFTLIELSLAMTFVAVLMVAIATLSIQLSKQYTRGLTLKEITQAGTEASADLKRTMSQSQIQGSSGVVTKDIAGATVLCTGTYSYIANSPEALDDPAAHPELIKIGTGATAVPARLVKVFDRGAALCSTPSELDVDKELDRPDASELLSGGSRLLSVRRLRVSPSHIPTDPLDPLYSEFRRGRGLYTVEMTISAGLQSEIAAGTQCKTPDEAGANEEYCAIDTFNFIVRVGSSDRAN